MMGVVLSMRGCQFRWVEVEHGACHPFGRWCADAGICVLAFTSGVVGWKVYGSGAGLIQDMGDRRTMGVFLFVLLDGRLGLMYEAGAMNQGAVVVTGAARRIGRAIALELARAGYSVVVHFFQSEAEAFALVDEIREAGGAAVALRANLALEDEARELIAEAGEVFGPLLGLVNNASVFERDEALSVTRESWLKHLDVNMWGPFVLCQAFARQDAPQDMRRCIINVLDQRVVNMTGHYISYSLSKAGLWTLTQTLALSLAPMGIRVNAIGPGRTLPNDEEMARRFEEHYKTLPLKAGTTPWEIGRCARFILESPSMTGQLILLDGGEHLL